MLIGIVAIMLITIIGWLIVGRFLVGPNEKQGDLIFHLVCVLLAPLIMILFRLRQKDNSMPAGWD